jgi:hypothetical protein
MTPVVFEPAIPVSERPQTHALDRVATGIGRVTIVGLKNNKNVNENKGFNRLTNF